MQYLPTIGGQVIKKMSSVFLSTKTSILERFNYNFLVKRNRSETGGASPTYPFLYIDVSFSFEAGPSPGNVLQPKVGLFKGSTWTNTNKVDDSKYD